ncbi:unnamed protein product [Caretta caretta]
MTYSSWSRTRLTWREWRHARPSIRQPPPPESTGSRALAWRWGTGGRLQIRSKGQEERNIIRENNEPKGDGIHFLNSVGDFQADRGLREVTRSC